MSKSTARSFSSAGKVSRGALRFGVTLAALGAVTAVVAARAGTPDPRVATVEAGRHVLSAAESWRGAGSGDGCPTITQLVEDGQLDRDARTDDSWGNRFRIVCDGTHAEVRSAGPDRRPGTPDDVKIVRGDG